MRLSGGKIRIGALAIIGVAALVATVFMIEVGKSGAASSTYGQILIAGGCGPLDDQPAGPGQPMFPLCPYNEIDVTVFPPNPAYYAGDFMDSMFTDELFDPAGPGFAPPQPVLDSESMDFAPAGAAASLIIGGPNAGKILISGGLDTYEPIFDAFDQSFCPAGQTYPNCYPNETNATDIYDPATNTFTLGPFMNVPRWEHTQTTITTGPYAGEIFIAGGLNNLMSTAFPPTGSWLVLNSTEVYDPVTGTFAPSGETPILPAHPPFTESDRAFFTATEIPSSPPGPNAGNILLAGGVRDDYNGALNSTDIYNPTPELPGAPYGTVTAGPDMTDFRTQHTATVLTVGANAGDIFIAGGSDSYDGNPTAKTELYETAYNDFVLGPDLTMSRADHIAEVIPSGPNAGDVLLIGGISYPSQIYFPPTSTDLYNPIPQPGAPYGTVTAGPATNFSHLDGVGATIPSGAYVNDILVAGGVVAVPILTPAPPSSVTPTPTPTPLATPDAELQTDIYDSATNSFMVGPPMNYARYSSIAIALPAGPLPTPTATATTSPIPTPTSTATPTVTATPTSTLSPSPTGSPTPTATVTATMTPSPTPTAHTGPTPTIVPSPTPTAVPELLTVTPASHNFGKAPVGTTTKQVTVKLKNKDKSDGRLPIFILGASTSPSSNYPIVYSDCPQPPYSLNYGAMCIMKVACDPAAPGPVPNGTLTITSNAANASQTVGPLTCTGK